MIMQKGMRLLKEKGFQNVTIANLCQETGIARPTFYSHFNSKNSLVAEYYECAYLFSADTQNWILSAFTNWESIVRLQMAYIQNTSDIEQVELISHYLTYKLTVTDEEYTSAFPQDMEEEVEALLIALIKKAQNAGEIRNGSEARYLGKAIMSLQLGNLFSWCASKGNVDRYKNLFWELEAILIVQPDLRGIWKEYDYGIPGMLAEKENEI